MADVGEGAVTFFVAKCINMDSLKRCAKNGIWACSDRKSPPQPKDTLGDALKSGKVILLFSVNNCHGWHGYASVLTEPGSVPLAEFNASLEESDSKLVIKDRDDSEDLVWHRFKIEWKKLYLKEHGEQCLPFSDVDLYLSDGQSVNKARNFQDIAPHLGREICQKIDDHYERLSVKKLKRIQEQKEKLPPPFFQPGVEVDPQAVWGKLVHKVEGMGKVLLACAFGSQRYNLHTAESDMDMFIVYAADTTDILGFNPPQHTIKNRDTETCDYTIHEVHRYCELLISGDPRCVETLFLHPSAVYYGSPEWTKLCESRKLFLTRQCAEKYMRDALGNKGIKLLDKWVASGDALQDPMPKKVAKLFYIIFRLLQNARDVLEVETIKVYRAEDSPERQLLMKIRSCQYTYGELKVKLYELLAIIERLKINSMEPNMEIVNKMVEDWLMELRYENFKKAMGENT